MLACLLGCFLVCLDVLLQVSKVTMWLVVITCNSCGASNMDFHYFIENHISFQLINAFCLNCTCVISKPYQIHIWDIYGSRTTPDASIGLVPYQTHIKSIYGPYMGHPSSPNWTLDFEPAFSPRFLPTLSLRSIFSTGQRFLPTLSPRSLFSTGQRFLPTLSPWSLFSTGQRFPLLNHVTSGYPWARDPFYPLVSGFPHRKWYDVINLLSTNQEPAFATN